MNTPWRASALDSNTLAMLYDQLATLDQAGLAPARMFTTISRDFQLATAQRLQGVARGLRTGRSLSTSMTSAALFPARDLRLIGAAEQAGQWGTLFKRLNRDCTRRAERGRRIRSRLMMPICLLVIGLLFAPLPDLIADRIGLAGYLWSALIPLAAIYTGYRLIADGRLSIESLQRLATRLPHIGRLLFDLKRRDFLASLAGLLRAGLPAGEALAHACPVLALPQLMGPCRGIEIAVRNGASLAETLSRSNLLDDPAANALIASGEAAGRLDEMLEHAARQLDQRLELKLDTIAEWLPRIVYGLVVVLAAGGLL